MLFRPSFCANCGEKIERADWGILTSRRFCEVCAAEFMGHEMIPRAVVGIGVLIGIFGLGSYLKSGSASVEPSVVRKPGTLVGQTTPIRQTPPMNTVQKPNEELTSATTNTQLTAARGEQIAQPRPEKPKIVTAEQVYFCGAETKKGTPCSRRVKGNTRCFQHVGMPAMAAEEKIKTR